MEGKRMAYPLNGQVDSSQTSYGHVRWIDTWQTGQTRTPPYKGCPDVRCVLRSAIRGYLILSSAVSLKSDGGGSNLYNVADIDRLPSSVFFAA